MGTPHGLTMMERFWSKVDRSGGPDACWPWTASLLHDGYGSFATVPNVETYRAHRFVLECALGESLGDMHALHTCDNRRCVNPDHLWPGTNLENIQDRMSKGR